MLIDSQPWDSESRSWNFEMNVKIDQRVASDERMWRSTYLAVGPNKSGIAAPCRC